jgi:hypothetical protein
MNNFLRFQDNHDFRPVVSCPHFSLRARRLTCLGWWILNEATGATCFFEAPRRTFYFAFEETAGGNR